MIKSFSCSNFKNVQAEDVECAGMNLLIGPNNSGKSNFLRAISFCSGMLAHIGISSYFQAEIKRNGGVNVLRQGADSRDISLRWRVDLQEETVDYLIGFTVGKSLQRIRMTQESLNLVKADGIVANNRNDVTFSLMDFFARLYLFSSSSFDYAKIRLPQIIDAGEGKLDTDGSNFLSVYQSAVSQSKEFSGRFTQKARQLIDGLESVTVESVADMAAMRLRFNGGSFWLSQVSDGTIEALLLALLTTLPGDMAPSVLAIDEPEVNLHPAWQKVIANWIQTSGNVPQCFISTHSPDFLDAFTDGFRQGYVQILVFDSNGSRTVEKLDREKLEPELAKGWLLGDLYRVGDPLIGGWPG